MALYRVVCDGIDILDYGRKDLILLNPHLDLEINTAGSLEFVIPPYHAFYDSIFILKSTIEVYEDDRLIWFGRPIETSIDFYKQKKVHCEGPFAFFNDTVMFPIEFEDTTIRQFWEYIITEHNNQVDNPNRKFQLGNFTVDNKNVYRKLNYENAHDALQRMCLDTNDGYFFFRRANGINYFDWCKDMPYACNQPVQFGINLLDLNSNFNASSMATCVLPLGKTVDDQPITISSVNGGSDILVSEAAATYGRVVHVETWSDISDPTELKEEGEKYLQNAQFNSLEIQCSAADLHPQNNNFDTFTVGQQVHCVSNPHLIDRVFPLSKITINLDSAAKIITLGLLKRKSLTRITMEPKELADDTSGTSDKPWTPGPGVIEDPDGIEWEIIPPEITGDTPTLNRMPTSIVVVTPPSKTIYEPGETIDYSGITVIAMCDEHVWIKIPQYAIGYIPFNELIFSAKKAPSIEDFSSQVIWRYNNKNYYAAVNFKTESGPERKTSDILPPYCGGYVISADEVTIGFTSSGIEHTYHGDACTGHVYISNNSYSIVTAIIASSYIPDDEYKSFTYQGHTVYYQLYKMESSSINGPMASIDCCEDSSIDIQSNDWEYIAWTMIFGSVI